MRWIGRVEGAHERMNLRQQKEDLLNLLQKAVELELATIPPYMTALLSIKPGTNRAAADIIRSVMMEEMLHLALVGNLMNSLGGAVRLEKDNIPSYPLQLEFEGKPFKDRKFEVHLAPYSRETIETFIKIELPAGLAPLEIELEAIEEIAVPALTIGDFYRRIVQSLEEMCTLYSESEVFVGNRATQVGPQFFWGASGRPIIVSNLNDAKAAIDIVVRQGEGADLSNASGETPYFSKPENYAHYFRFKEIVANRKYQINDSPYGPPQGESLNVDFEAVYPIVTDPAWRQYQPGSVIAHLDSSYNRQYSTMLKQIELAFNGSPDLLYEAITNGMHGLTSIALEMMHTPVSADCGKTGAPSYEWVELP